MEFNCDIIDFSLLDNKDKNENNEDKYDQDIFDITTCETYRIRRMFKIDPITDLEIPIHLQFKFDFSWDPYTGIRKCNDIIGPLYFNANDLYDYYYQNRFNGLWNPPIDLYQGYYGDLVGSTKHIIIKSRGSNPEKYLFRLPIIDCYLPKNHNYSIITMGPELTNDEILQIDKIIIKYHPKKKKRNFLSLTNLKSYYDKALESSPDQSCYEIKDLKKKYPNFSDKDINDKYNRHYVDLLVNLKY